MENNKEIIVDGNKYIVIEQDKRLYAYKPFKYTLLTMPNFPIAEANTLDSIKKKLSKKDKLNQFLWII